MVMLFTACTKQQVAPPPAVDESQWLNQDRGVVAFSDFNCDYYVVQTMNGYAVLRSWSGTPPFQGSTLYGDFSGWGVKTFYNRSGGYLIRAEVRRNWLSYFEAIDELNYRCSGQWP